MIKEFRSISPYELRALCIRENWYTRGTNEEYNEMLEMCGDGFKRKKLTTARIQAIATDIMKHSTVPQDTEFLLNIMYCICEASNTYFEYVED